MNDKAQSMRVRKTIVAACLLLGVVLCCAPADDGGGPGSERPTGITAGSARLVPDPGCAGEIARRMMQEAWAVARAQGRAAAR